MFCPKCGNQLENQDIFCPQCGAPVNRQRQMPVYQQPTPPLVQPEPKKKKSKAPLIIGIVLAVLFVGAVAAGVWHFLGQPALIEEIELKETAITLTPGEKCRVEYAISPETAEGDLEWESDDENVAEVSSSGRITAIGGGTCTITVTSDSGAKAKLQVNVQIPVEKIWLDQSYVTLKVGDTYNPTYGVLPQDAQSEIWWGSSNEDVATVNQFGKVTAVGSGECDIVAMAGDDVSKSFSVWVEEPETPFDPESLYSIHPDDIPDIMTSDDGIYEIAFVTDVGPLKDHSFNQATYDGVKLFANANGLSYKYYQPANGNEATDDDRYEAMRAAIDNGASVVVCTGFMQGTALEMAAEQFWDVKFVFIDGWCLGMDNVAGVVFREEQCGYLAGYAAVKDGYTKLGFCGGGGGTNDACCRYGYGYVQGANAAAEEMGITVEINYTWKYGAAFSPSAELQTLCAGWYENGTEVIFSCGGSIFDSITAAAATYDAYVIGVDVDQSYDSSTVVTSAMKDYGQAAIWALEEAYYINGGDWWSWGWDNCIYCLGAYDGAICLPIDTWSLKNWTVEEYEDLLEGMADGSVVVDYDFNNLGNNTPNVSLNLIE